MIHDKQWKCVVCKVMFSRASLLAKHKECHKKTEEEMEVVVSHQCKICAKTFRKLRQLDAHVAKIHGELDSTFKCRYCAKGFMHSSKLIRHERIHFKDRPFECNVCFQSFLKYSWLVKHQQSHLTDGGGGEDPAPTDPPVIVVANWQQNIISGDLKSVDSANCVQPAMCFPRFETERKYACEICGKSFFRSGHYKSHIKIHNREKTLQKEISNRDLSRLPIFDKDINRPILQTVNSSSMKASCCSSTKCPSYKNLSATNSLGACRKQIATSVPKTFKCLICNELFSCSNSLDCHLETHIIVKPSRQYKPATLALYTYRKLLQKKRFHCPVCLKVFSSPVILQRHARIIHSQLVRKLQMASQLNKSNNTGKRPVNF